MGTVIVVGLAKIHHVIRHMAVKKAFASFGNFVLEMSILLHLWAVMCPEFKKTNKHKKVHLHCK